MDRKTNIVILGAGVGGLTTAIALRQKGFENITIFEQRQTSVTIGAGIVLWANASKILNKLGLLTEVQKIGGKIKQMERWTDKEEFLGSINVSTIDTVIGATSYSASRKELQEILLKKTTDLKIPVFYNHKAMQLSSSDNKAQVLFDNGGEIKADIVIGGDGRMNSAARQYVNGDNKPVYQNFVNWIGIVESDKPIFSNAENVLDFWGYGERFGIVPINKFKGYWAGGKSLPLNSPFKTKNNKEELLKLFATWSPKIENTIQLSKEENIKYIEVFDHNPISKWHKNNVCLIGDSAHAALPTSGQGACQAIEDGWELASVLEEAKTHYEAFAKFQKNRFQKTTAITIAGRELAKSLFNEDPVFCNYRNENAKKTDYNLAAQNIAQLWSLK
ncbi:FAD-dependent monooxygenase [Flavobacterium marginilacus]|uniref:FAD-dependent monooxygenase n=1 Tax=Flavobacterium marginilacus TaxID=3003256 RepID=UPI00248EA60D|nr:FAD-dependent monooxygenase [Flavobacterium marginilacus]